MIEVTNQWDIICNLCILILENLSHMTGLSYGFLNIILFVILSPVAILSFMSSATILFMNKNRAENQILVAKLLFVIGIFTVLSIIVPIIIAFLNLPF